MAPSTPSTPQVPPYPPFPSHGASIPKLPPARSATRTTLRIQFHLPRLQPLKHLLGERLRAAHSGCGAEHRSRSSYYTQHRLVVAPSCTLQRTEASNPHSFPPTTCSSPSESSLSRERDSCPPRLPVEQTHAAHCPTFCPLPAAPPNLCFSTLLYLSPRPRKLPTSPGSQKRPPTATIPSPHSLAAILSPSAPTEDSAAPSNSRCSRSPTPKRTHAEAFAADQSYLHPASPRQQLASIDPTGDPSPGSGGADDGSAAGVRGSLEEKKPTKMVRSSIACSRCRRSKVKCVNNGVNSICKACASSNRECTYPVAGSISTPKRNEATAGVKQEDGESKKRIRKLEDTGRRNSQKVGEDILESPILTRKVWDEIYEIFKLHFSTEMPFLHPPTFRNRMRQASYPRDPSAPPADLQEGRLLLLGVLTLTARFHPELVAHHSSSSDPLVASEYYAAALATAFGPTSRNLTNPSLEGIQAFLMLGLYEWGQTRGLSAWVYVGIATRLAQSMGLSYEDDTGPLAIKYPAADPSKSRSAKPPSTAREELTEKEARRRTWWSCFIMDRMLSAGKCRPTMIDVDRLRVQLPCSDDDFLFARKSTTGILNPSWNRNIEPGVVVHDDGILGWYIRLVEIFGRFAEWSYAGGRRTETLPPWDSSTGFFKLRHELEEFRRSLPSNLVFNEENLSAHIEKRNATGCASMHTLYSACLIMLHREYLPFIPLRCEKPTGPLDEPTFPSSKYEVPDGFWEESAETVFKAARDIINIVTTCQEDNALPESPQIGFAVWQAAFFCIYAVHFGHMDTGNHLHNPKQEPGADFRTRGWTGITSKLLKDMVPRLKMVKAYQKTIGMMHDYFDRVKADFHTTNNGNLGWTGGGGEQYRMKEKELKEFGSLSDTDRNIQSDGSDAADQTRSRASTNDIGPASSVNGEPMQGVESAAGSRPNGSWAPINAQSSQEGEERTKYNVQYPYGMPYQQSPNQSNPPSLISPSNADSTSSLNSPYVPAQNQQYHASTAIQPVSAYPIAPHGLPIMAPPNTQATHAWSQEEKERRMTYFESIGWGAQLDNLGQDYTMESLQLAEGDAFPPNRVLNYMQAASYQWVPPAPVTGTGGF
ncbi:uncharacterized protein BP5553_09384 [Venustampulla echinocandica]|uniref:Zn(2)-C6 fungal-type domain-containing protein n=1 Tax=Venustampulla echinocandica TaxID=2656787 RepID=A0A370TCK8_9HELO|nr:uncharacterized protein BP5553_09384 [Venustampulla echinocandica]RDL31982.1 hypothetical protein BP5553_09384 [Venustampulla echinocandica]